MKNPFLKQTLIVSGRVTANMSNASHIFSLVNNKIDTMTLSALLAHMVRNAFEKEDDRAFNFCGVVQTILQRGERVICCIISVLGFTRKRVNLNLTLIVVNKICSR